MQYVQGVSLLKIKYPLRQAVRPRILIPTFGGSNPSGGASYGIDDRFESLSI